MARRAQPSSTCDPAYSFRTAGIGRPADKRGHRTALPCRHRAGAYGGAMRNRYQKPADPPPSLKLLGLHLSQAQPPHSERLSDPYGAEARRVEAVTALLALARNALANADEWHNMVEGKPHEPRSYLGAIPRELRGFLETAGLRIFTADDPIAALQRFLGNKPPARGRPAEDHQFRDYLIAADVAELLHADGLSLDSAYEAVSKRPGTPGRKAIERIYLRLRDDLAVRAELGWRHAVGGRLAGGKQLRPRVSLTK